MPKPKAVAAPVEPKAAATPAVTPEAPDAPVEPTAKASKSQFRVFNDRANIVAQVTDEDEARELAAEHKGHYSEVK